MVLVVNNLSADAGDIDMWVRSLGQEDPLKEGMATHSTILAWRIPMDRVAWWATVYGVAKSWTQMSDQEHTVLAVSIHWNYFNKLVEHI